MKRNVLNLLVGVIIGCLITTSVTVYASDNFQSIQVVFNKVNLSVNGQKVAADNILYNGTTYVPIRKVAEMFSKNVSWNAQTNTASINDVSYVEPAQPVPPAPSTQTQTNSGSDKKFSFKEFSYPEWFKINSKLYKIDAVTDGLTTVYCLNEDYSQVYVPFNPSLYIQGKTDLRIEGEIVSLLALINKGYDIKTDNPYIDGTIDVTDFRPYKTIGMSIKQNITYLNATQQTYSYTYSYNNHSLSTPDTENLSTDQEGVHFVKYNETWLVNLNDFLHYFNFNNDVKIEYSDIVSANCFKID